MPLRTRLFRVLLFLGAAMTAPLLFQLRDYRQLQEASRALAVEVTDADQRLAKAAVETLTAEFKALRAYTQARTPENKRRVMTHHARFLLYWEIFTRPDRDSWRRVEDLPATLGVPPGDVVRLEAAIQRVASRGGAGWPEDPAKLQAALDAAMRSGPEVAGRKRLTQFRRVATLFRARLLGLEAGSGPSRDFENRVRGTSRVVLLELMEAKRVALLRGAGLLLVSAALAVFFCRVLSREIIGPLDHLRGAVNNMAMSGTPTKTVISGPREVRELAQAYNRLIDVIAGEGGPAPDVAETPCRKCSRLYTKGDKYCASCGFPL